MSKLTKIRVGGVPEHFNLTWHLAMENGLFEKEGIELEWTVFKGGTGQMTKALRDNEIDVCILLTEGIISDIVKGNPSKLIGKYLNTPLIWGVYTGINNPVNYYGEIYDKNYAISRFGSGSHLMPIVDANAKKIKIKEEQFQVIKNLEGALESLTENETDAFDNMLKVIYFTSKQFMLSPTSVQEVSDRYNQKLEDVESWFHATEWSVNNDISDKLLKNVLHTLHYAGIIDEKPELAFFKA